jgi:uncharacterized protein (DUF983 family)
MCTEDDEVTCPSCAECSLFTLHWKTHGIPEVSARCQNCRHEFVVATVTAGGVIWSQEI